MSDTLQALSALVLVQKYRGRLVNVINRTSVALKLLPIKAGSGKNCAWGIKLSGQVSENYSEGADASNFGSNAQVPAVLNWGMYRANSHVSGTALRAAAGSDSPEGADQLFEDNMIDGAEDLTSRLNQAIFTGAGSGTTMAGLNVALGDDSNTYATIDRSDSTYASFRPYVVDPGVYTPISFTHIRTDLSTIQTNSGRRPRIALCSPLVFNQIAGLFDSSRIKYEETVQTSRGAVVLDHSQRGVIVENCMFIPDKDASAGYIYYLPPDEDDLAIEYLPPAPLARIQQAMQAMAGVPLMPANDGYGQAPLGYEIQPLAKNGDSERFSLVTNLQLRCRRPNAGGVRKHVKYA